MANAVREGEQGLGLTSPNPAVGAVIVLDDEVIGRGWHQVAGGPHAEVEAIENALENVDSEELARSTLYVTLEPCSTAGKTPPCVEAIRKAGITQVVVGSTDPNPAHAGSGFALLREAGVEVTTGVLEEETDQLLRYFRSRVERSRPWVIAKSAITLDGRTTLAPGEGQWISSPESLEDVQKWRRQCDAILVGGQSLRTDNPRLTLRGEFAKGRSQPLRVVFTSDENLPVEHHLFTDEFCDRTRIHRGMSLAESLQSLAEEGANAVMLESGGRLLSHALSEGLVDEVILYLAPRLGGGSSRLLPTDSIVAQLESIEATSIGPDIRIRGQVEETRRLF
jgi:diaminohydroxyphosphoribosylaminopyrimidine deaminase/5-amino-6-(5-phosphoribosylamino)uracil reductase